MNEDDIKTLLLASLLHDLGQYPLAHEIGELREEFKHENFTLKFLDNETKDNNNRTIKEIIEDFEFGWGCKVENIKRLLGIKRDIDIFSEKQNIKQAILKSIIDGPIDVDKSDYLLRDSQNCYLKYGESIDFDRLVRSLTIIITKEKYERTICTIGTYDKGQTAAESLSFARYLLFQSLYWHHTSRAIRAMLKVALIPAFDKKKAREKYESFYKAIEDYLGLRGNPKITAIDDMLNLIIGWSDSTGKELIRMIKDRKYYKRILTIHSEPSKEENGKTTLLDRFRSASNKLRFQEILQSEIRKAFQSFLDESESRRESLLSHSKMDFALEMLEKPKTILCDCPDPSSVYGTTDKLRFIFEPKRLHHNYFIRSETGERISEVWNQVYFRLMNIVAKGRIFCHPDIRDTLMAGLGPQRLIRCLEVTTESHYTKL